MLKSLKEGSKLAFTEVFDLYHKRVYGLAKSMGLGDYGAEEILQEVFIVIWDNKIKIDEKKPFDAYILLIAKRLIIKAIRRRTLEEGYRSTLKESDLTEHTTEDYIIFKDLLDCANTKMEGLSTGKKQVFMLSKYEGLSNQEIAEKLNISIRTVENQLYRATKEIKHFISKSE